MNILYIYLKCVTWRFRICNYFREMCKFRDFMNTLRNFEKSVLLIFSRNLNISRKNWNLQTRCFKMIPMICSYFQSLKFFRTAISWSHCGVISQKLLIKSRNQNIFPTFKMNPTRCEIPFPTINSSLG